MKHLDEIKDIAQKVLMENGQHMAQLNVYGSKSSALLAFADFPSDFDIKMRMMLGAGAKVADGDKLGELEEVYFISEVWMGGMIEKDDFKKGNFVMPRDNPDRQEALMIVAQDLKNKGKPIMYPYMIKRSPKGDIMGLSAVDATKNMEVDSPLLDAFVFGFDKAKGN